MSEHKQKLDAQLDRLEAKLPEKAAKPVRHLRKPGWVWVRVPAGLLLMVGGVFSFLPVLGIWMLPLGLALIAIDVPPLHRPTARLIGWGLDKWSDWQGKPSAR